MVLRGDQDQNRIASSSDVPRIAFCGRRPSCKKYLSLLNE
jgi:hypothetical protein